MVRLLWPLFFVWTVLVAAVWATGFGDFRLKESVANPELQAALSAILRHLDGVWLLLAAINGYLVLCATEGLATARRWTGLILIAGLVIPGASALAGIPLGPVAYSNALGSKLGPVSLGIPLLWFVVVVGSRECALRLFPRANHFAVAGTSGLLILLTDLNLEPIASSWRAWWIWYPGDRSPPAHLPGQNFATWLLAGFALVYFMRSPSVVVRSSARRGQAALILISINAVCLLAHAVHFSRR